MNENERMSARILGIRTSILRVFLESARWFNPGLQSIDDLQFRDAGSLTKLFKQILEALPDEVVLLLEIPSNPIMNDSEWNKRIDSEIYGIFDHFYKYPSWFNVVSGSAVVYFNRVPGLIQTNVLANQRQGYRMEQVPDGRVAVIVPLAVKS